MYYIQTEKSSLCFLWLFTVRRKKNKNQYLSAVSLQPEVLILDEPIAQLDPKHADQIYAVLRELNENYGKTIIVIEHHTEYIADFCKHVLSNNNQGDDAQQSFNNHRSIE